MTSVIFLNAYIPVDYFVTENVLEGFRRGLLNQLVGV